MSTSSHTTSEVRTAWCGWCHVYRAPHTHAVDGYRIATTEAVASVTRIPAPDVADKGASCTPTLMSGGDLDQPLLHGMGSNAASHSVRPGEGVPSPGAFGKLRNDPTIRRMMTWARWDYDDAIRERHPEVKRLMRDRMRRYVRFARFRLHRLMREAHVSDEQQVSK